ncbi:MAG: hypothetical protein ACTHJN_12410, partial [Ginsengibacter sp.]
DGSISIYEIKTSIITRKNIREALAQLVDYASHSGRMKINKLVIVSPGKIEKDENKFLKELRRVINYPIFYFSFNDGLKPRFTIYE